MRPPIGIVIAVLLLVSNGVAEATDTTRLAEKAGFLLDNAHRCGVPTERVGRAGKVIHDLMPSRPGEFHPEPLTDPDVILSHHPARATERRPPPSVEK